MNILICGSNPIGFIYGYLLTKAGHCVEHWIEEESRFMQVEPIQVSILDGRERKKVEQRQEKYSIRIAEEQKEYDVILMSGDCVQLEQMIQMLHEQNRSGPIVLLTPIWQSADEVKNMLHNQKYMLAFPIASGAFEENRVTGVVFSHVMLESKKKSNASFYDTVCNLFHSIQIQKKTPYDMFEWNWIYIAVGAGIMVSLPKGKRIEQGIQELMQQPTQFQKTVKTIKACLKIVEARGVDFSHYQKEVSIYYLPTTMLRMMSKRALQNNSLIQSMLKTPQQLEWIQTLTNEVYEWGKTNHVKAPIFYEAYNKKRI